MLTAISPLEGRYHHASQALNIYFSEYALIKYRLFVELEYLKALIDVSLPPLSYLDVTEAKRQLDLIFDRFDLEGAQKIKDIEKVTNHDVKAVEYYIKQQLDNTPLEKVKEFVHFGLTSQDINNTAFPLMIKAGLEAVIVPNLRLVVQKIEKMSQDYKGIAMLARTHGQPASPTTLGKEMAVFVERIEDELQLFSKIELKCKFGGATGNFNAHKVTFPDIDWLDFGRNFASSLGLKRSIYTTQIAHYDDIAAICHQWSRIHTILIDFCRDIWTYISMDYFKQKIKAGEVGSSAMPHKVNPIDFENAEGNLGYANAIFGHLADKLPISRLQRDLTDSTVLRNIGVPFGHGLIALHSISKGIDKLLLHSEALETDLDKNWAVVTEAIQNILRRELYHEPYEALKLLSRGKTSISKDDIHQFIDQLDISEEIKAELKMITPHNYVGYF